MPSSTPTPGRRGPRRPAPAACAALLVAGLVSACGTPGSTAANSSADTTAVSTAIPTDKVTLSVLSSDTSETTKALSAAFEKKHPNVTVDFRFTGVDSYDTSLDLTLGSDSAPDLALLNKLGNTAKAGLIRNLDPYVDAYGWDKTVSASELGQWRADGQGKTLGVGKLWAAPAGFSLVGVYYNKDIAAKLGIEPPKTLGEFEQDLAKAKTAGVLPIQMPNMQGQSSYLFQALTNTFQGPGKSTEWAFGNPGSTIENVSATRAAQQVADWAEQGYLPSGANGTDGAAAMSAFTKGEGLFMFDGNWDATAVDKALPGKAGFFTLPGESADAPSTGVGTSLAYAIPSKAKHPDLAAAFLDFMTTPEAAAIEFGSGYMPVAQAETVKTPDNSILKDYAAAWAAVAKSDGLVPYFNNSTPTMNDTLTSQGQQLVAGKTSPADYLKALQDDWEKGHK
ncbi:extracellular solute-binding protein [Kitasatospora sp. NA04385]|uniref:ABC transporter substrate-binding protein n=1 Tax=Kitasatospora sp. NA04385 TaxID=2742135 RepID=UPI0015908B17|nr:extracellular solute-binding protein [Kitasatospora sp. NA04385]QKW17755.1 extracellular solute-binding protein [Kitasatospora sp. NA04385]